MVKMTHRPTAASPASRIKKDGHTLDMTATERGVFCNISWTKFHREMFTIPRCFFAEIVAMIEGENDDA